MADDVQPAPESPPPVPEVPVPQAAEPPASAESASEASEPSPAALELVPVIESLEPLATEIVSEPAIETVAPISTAELPPTEIPSPVPAPASEASSPATSQVTTSSIQVDVAPIVQANTLSKSGHQLNQEERKRGNSKRLQNREEALEKIVAHARTTEWITNDAVEKLLHVSNATASRYLKMLVARGLMVKEGKTRAIRYKIVR